MGGDLNGEYMKYQEKKMDESNAVLMIGNLFVRMGEYDKAERFFDTILSSSIFFNFSRIHALKGDFNRAISCYNRAYECTTETCSKC